MVAGMGAYEEIWRVLLLAGIDLDKDEIKKSRGKRGDC